jgi:putative transposase
MENHLVFQGDNGSEFCAGSKKKEEWLNEQLKKLNASFRSIPAGKKYLQGIVERSHRTDDEEFYRLHLEKIRSSSVFLCKAQQWQDTYNSLRQSWGKGMNGNTPLKKHHESDIFSPEKVLHFPVLILDKLYSVVRGGNYLLDHYRFWE